MEESGEDRVINKELDKERRIDEDEILKVRREIIKTGVIASTILSLGGFVKIFEPIVVNRLQPLKWPRLRIINIRELRLNRPIFFNYPLITTPNILVKLGMEAENGIGPDKDIVAFSRICQHQGCLLEYIPAGRLTKVPIGFCSCHRGIYDFLHNAKVIGGPIPRPVPAVILEYQESSGDIFAVGMKPPVIYGLGPPGSDDVDLNLMGGELVGEKV
ncbi:MAG: Rieske 2Fe-2S domain-containing protein [Nitrososphaerota archaeon]|nr:Rieske 2Fe-2S domain-containing protein [Nitrososphaerota archaeon]